MVNEKKIVRKEELNLTVADNGIDMEGIEGVGMQDLPMPSVKLVHGTSKNVDLSKIGKWYHSGKQEYKDQMEIVILYAKHGKQTDYKDENVQHDCMRALCVDRADPEIPFAITFAGTMEGDRGSFGGGWTPFMKLIATFKHWKVKQPWTRGVLLGSTSQKSTDGKNEFYVPTLEMTEELSKQEIEIMQKLREKYNSRKDYQEEEDGHTASVFINKDETEDQEDTTPFEADTNNIGPDLDSIK
jgi:hypothetical protein